MIDQIQRFAENRLALFIGSLLVLCFSLTACAQKHTARKAAKTGIKQGICGIVVVKRGNYMPGPGSARPNPDGLPAEREVLIFPLLNMSQVEAGENGFINSVGDAKPIQTVKSGKDGKFCVSLPVGQYSVLVREPKGLYANLSDTHNNIFPVSVLKNRTITVTVAITHQAVF